MRLLFPLLLLLLSSCKVGPNYCPPIASVPASYHEASNTETSSTDQDLVAWWKNFNDPHLNALLEESLKGNFDYKMALERILQAREFYSIQRAELLPELNGDFQASRFRTSQNVTSSSPTINPVRSLFQTGIDMVWQIDLFGKLRRSADAAKYRLDATCEEARGIKITVLSEVVATYTTICLYQEKVVLATERLELDRQIGELLLAEYYAGLINEQTGHLANAKYQSDHANLLFLQASLKAHIYSLATLLGRNPESLLTEFEPKHPIPLATEKIPTSLPSDLLRRRPDISHAERSLAAATEDIGIATADLYPQFSLTGSGGTFGSFHSQGANAGFSSDSASNLFSAQSRTWGFGGIVTFPIFDFGKRRSAVCIQQSKAEEAYLIYQKTVITALEEVEKSLASYYSNEKRLGYLYEQNFSYEQNYALDEDRFNAGLINYIDFLHTQESWIDALEALAQSKQDLAISLVDVYKALGGNW